MRALLAALLTAAAATGCASLTSRSDKTPAPGASSEAVATKTDCHWPSDLLSSNEPPDPNVKYDRIHGDIQ